MPTEIAVSVVTVCGTILVQIIGMWANSRVTAYRIQQLEKKVDKHNHFAERVPVLEEKIAVANHRISDLESNA